ncbi:ATP-binding SpoIIE family protein phosphatase [Yinghuangia soli]|uniref:SpoIIE family protein phosphatase n=1 Tax=Yinghuangia soli TaxID=2908204 RepID=A0AA41U1V1_9ACTN|nr:SpoIIE family protein phosphatase [Yinghuangia soli]MCF2531118.1 SpoIIE family protein phosphatase [Yinghuangia soli]
MEQRLVAGLGLSPTWAEQLAAAVFTQDIVALAVFDTDLRVVATNITAKTFPQLPIRVGDDANALFPALGLHDVTPLLRCTLTSGNASVRLQPLAAQASDGDLLHLSIGAFRVSSEDGAPLGLLVTFDNVTEQVSAESRMGLVRAAAAIIGTSLDVTETAQQLAAVLVPGVADMVAVDLAESILIGDEPEADAATGYTPTVRAAVAQIGPSWPASLVQVGEAPPIPPDNPEALALHRGVPVLVPHVLTDLTTPSGLLSRLLPEGGHSLAAAPLFARGLLLGAVQIWRTDRPEPFDDEDARLLQEVASRAALSVDNARRYTRERRVALALQHSLLPEERTDEPAATTFGAYLPASAGVGGDWYDVIPLSSLRVALVVGDVVGHGLQASAAMGRLRTAVQALADMDLPPDELLTHVDDLVVRMPGSPDDASTTGATCLYVEYDPVGGLCRMASAGHPPPVVVEPGRRPRYVDLEPGPPLGVGGMPFEVADLTLAPESVLVLYSDGLVSGPEHDLETGMQALLDQVDRFDCAHRDLDKAGHDLLETVSSGTRTDDATLLLARVHPLPQGDSITWEFPADPACVSKARDLVTAQLTQWRLEELAFPTELVVSELVTNAVRYGGGPIKLRLIRGSVLVCEVSDPSNTQPRLRRARSTDEGGRGLFLVAQLTQRWGSRYGQSGKTIWAEQALDTEPTFSF